MPMDADTDNTYMVTVKASYGSGAEMVMGTQTVTIMVTDEDEPGTVVDPVLVKVLAKFDTGPKDGMIDLSEATDALRRFIDDPTDVPLNEATAVLRLFQGNNN